MLTSSDLNQLILKTLTYAQVFFWPLTELEIHKYLVNSKKCKSRNPSSLNKKTKGGFKKSVSLEQVSVNLKKLVKQKKVFEKVFNQQAFYILALDKKILANKKNLSLDKLAKKLIKQRLQREKISQYKLNLVRKVSGYLKILPGLNLLAVSGNVAIGNATINDDIDILIISQASCLWLIRPLVIFILALLGKRRWPKNKGKQAKNKLCLNLWLDQDNILIPLYKHNLFTARELAQLKPIINRNKTYERFLQKNKWIKEYLINAV